MRTSPCINASRGRSDALDQPAQVTLGDIGLFDGSPPKFTIHTVGCRRGDSGRRVDGGRALRDWASVQFSSGVWLCNCQADSVTTSCRSVSGRGKWFRAGLRRVHGIAQMRDTHTGDDCRIPEDGRCVREVVEQPHSCA